MPLSVRVIVLTSLLVAFVAVPLAVGEPAVTAAPVEAAPVSPPDEGSAPQAGTLLVLGIVIAAFAALRRSRAGQSHP